MAPRSSGSKRYRTKKELKCTPVRRLPPETRYQDGTRLALIYPAFRKSEKSGPAKIDNGDPAILGSCNVLAVERLPIASAFGDEPRALDT